MLLKKLIKIYPKELGNINITGLTLDSRTAKHGNVFFCLKGTKKHGDQFIKKAVQRGVKVVITNNKTDVKNQKIHIIKVKNPHNVLVEACKKFFFKKPKNIIAVTGTNGKSSVADFFYQLLYLNKIPVSSIGTLGVKKNNRFKKINLTSPDIISLHKELHTIKKNKIDNVIIEASSHGLKQGRLDGIDFKAGIFTNFSHDHLDYHFSMSNYFKSKMILFSKLLKEKKYIILDDKIKEFKKINIIAKQKKLKILKISSLKKKLKKNHNLIGNFQTKNILMAIFASNICGLKFNKINQTINKLKSVSGRLEFIKTFSNNSKVFLDYAHTPHALETAIKSLIEKFNKKIVLVFGCGGERDFKKRKAMAKIADKYCKKICITDDNPRKENPQKIRRDIIKHIKKTKYVEISKRKKAIQKTIQDSENSEIILVAGKGHEEYQIYGNKLFNISDKKIILSSKSLKAGPKKVKISYLKNSFIINKIINNKKKYEFSGVSFNSKTINKKNLFIAIKGNKKDGHDFVGEALKKGAKYIVVSKLKKKYGNKQIKVKNTNNFLNKFSKLKRLHSNAEIIGITGSSGKTTLKTLLGKILNEYGKTYFSPKSFNNKFGVPISLCNLEWTHRFGVFEIGMNKPGEINSLSKIVRPDVAVITNVSEAHIQNFKNLKGIANAKAEIIRNISKNGTIILNKEDKFYNFFKKLSLKENLKVVSFGLSKNCDIRPISIKKKLNNQIVKIKVFDEIITINNQNKIRLSNILALLATLKTLNLNLKYIENKLKFIKPLSGRGKIHRIKRFKTNFNLIDESYNANPRSMAEAINNFSKIKEISSKKYLLLGDMLELGNNSELFHKNLSKFINKADIDKLFVYGKKILNTYKYTYPEKRGNILQYKKDFDEVFSNVLKKGDYLMIKASNGIGLNELSKQIIKGTKNVI